MNAGAAKNVFVSPDHRAELIAALSWSATFQLPEKRSANTDGLPRAPAGPSAWPLSWSADRQRAESGDGKRVPASELALSFYACVLECAHHNEADLNRWKEAIPWLGNTSTSYQPGFCETRFQGIALKRPFPNLLAIRSPSSKKQCCFRVGKAALFSSPGRIPRRRGRGGIVQCKCRIRAEQVRGAWEERSGSEGRRGGRGKGGKGREEGGKS